MATSNSYTRGLMPAVNDLLAVAVVLSVYVVRFGTVAEGVEPSLALVPLYLTTDLLLPLLGATWLLAMPTVQLWQRLQ